MLTPYVVSKMGQNKPEEVLKLLNSNVESPYLIWDNGTRAELTDFLENERTSSVRRYVMSKKCQNVLKMAQNGQKMAKIGPKWPEKAQIAINVHK